MRHLRQLPQRHQPHHQHHKNMENEEQIIKDAYKTLSDDVKSIIGSSEWLKRVQEIGQKYSLTVEQIDSLGYEILFTFLNLQSPDLLNETIEEELDISSILAEQIVEEIEERIFAWAMKKIEQKQTPEIKENTLDIPPPNLPGEIIEEFIKEKVPVVVSTTPTATLLRDEVKDFFAQPTQQENLTPQETPVPQQSTFTPPMEQPFVPQSPRSFITQKLTQPSTLSTPPVDTPKTYSVDPYREPIE